VACCRVKLRNRPEDRPARVLYGPQYGGWERTRTGESAGRLSRVDSKHVCSEYLGSCWLNPFDTPFQAAGVGNSPRA
jgi:hypothetical protein